MPVRSTRATPRPSSAPDQHAIAHAEAQAWCSGTRRELQRREWRTAFPSRRADVTAGDTMSFLGAGGRRRAHRRSAREMLDGTPMSKLPSTGGGAASGRVAGLGRSGSRGSGALAPAELALMRAVLQDAILCYLGRAKRRRVNPRILAREAEHWIRINDWESPFSFNNVCEALGLSHESTRQTILEWRNAPEDALATLRETHA
jgi:hypothetical protein